MQIDPAEREANTDLAVTLWIDDAASRSSRRSAATRTPRWMQVVGIHAIGLVLLFVVMHLAGGGLWSH